MKIYLTLFLIIFLSFITTGKVLSQSATTEAKFIKVSYELPYPGILPDNPLYFLKALRDNFVNLLITDTLKKGEYDLLMADKRMAGGRELIVKKNYQLAITTISKSGNYFDRAISLAAKAKREGKDAKELLDRLNTASQKHQLVLYLLSQQTKGDVKYQLELLQVRVKGFQDTVDVVRSQ